MQTGTCANCGKQDVLAYGFCSIDCQQTYNPPTTTPTNEKRPAPQLSRTGRACGGGVVVTQTQAKPTARHIFPLAFCPDTSEQTAGCIR